MIESILTKYHRNPVFIIVIVLLFFFNMLYSKGSNEFIKDFTNIQFLFKIGFVLISSIIILRVDFKTQRGKSFKNAVRKALAALFIAYLAHLDLIFTPFFLVLVVDFYVGEWF